VLDVLAGYQAWVLPQCSQRTEVETGASNTNPQAQLYRALSCVGGPLRGLTGASVTFRALRGMLPLLRSPPLARSSGPLPCLLFAEANT
jgi:hypothetical protein